MISIIIPNTDAFPQLSDTSKIRKASQVGVLLHNFDVNFLVQANSALVTVPGNITKEGTSVPKGPAVLRGSVFHNQL